MNTILEAQEGRSSSYWKMANLFHKQLSGLQIGLLMRMKEENRTIPQDFDVTWFAYFINFYPSIGDYVYSFNKKKVSINVVKFFKTSKHSFRKMRPPL